MENNTNQISTNLCKKNCGFFGNPAFDGYCSKCYKEHVKRQNSGTAAGRVTPTSISSLNNESSTQLAAAAAEVVPIVPMEVAEVETTNTVTANQEPTATTTTTTSSVTFNLISNDNDNNSNSIVEANNVNINVNNATNSSIASPNSISNVQLSPNNNVLPEVASSSSVASMDSENSNKKKRNRCNVDTCRRKLGLTGFDCRCGNVFCAEHRYSDKHECQFDYKQLGQEQIRKNNPVVVGEKIQKL